MSTHRPDQPKIWATPLDSETIKKVQKKDRAWSRYLETREEAKYVEYVKLRNQVRNLGGKREKLQITSKRTRRNLGNL